MRRWVSHAAPITCAILNAGQSVQHAMSSRNAKQRFSLSIKTKRKRTLKPFLQCLKQKYLWMCLRNVLVLLNVFLSSSLGQSCSTNHVCDIEYWTECPARNVQQKFSLSIKTKKKRRLKS